ncbi:SIR2 family protein [Klebsiella pneumoniae]|uniref:SIR2 family protein n=1 Tax=Klebsiella pneumoniae TaxID=573 RepID=UPI001EE860AB|nr:SIR2 family protein [Klebsiella pneumoniae]HDU5769863.1 hypothetical protein [Klebsiella pneumoniae subsp. pneumoniae]MCG5551245.1 SIR2 family protein [Klebsiella pneumoniae]MCG5559973.1 SIR2 family protein [Klebsiella pneumoniae]MCH9359158.1 SIR2 family protein [Klebsiella pneumoniae]MCP6417060.1 SIR2 family protein [Klebsiella pneumoniae]
MITLLFGAGASFGSRKCFPHVPPQGAKLFEALENLKGAFYALPSDTKDIFRNEGFEAGMLGIPNDNRIITPLQKELALYLSSFTIENDNAYLRLFKKIRLHIPKITISTLNYDLLIEQALLGYNIGFTYDIGESVVKLLKLHGSSNFLPELPEGVNISGNVMIGCGSFIETNRMNAVMTHSEIKVWCQNPRNSELAPAIAKYERNKGVPFNSGAIKKVQSIYHSTVMNSSLLIVIGARYLSHDEHIWKCIEKSNSKVIVVDPDPQYILGWLEEHKRNNYEVIVKGFYEAVNDIAWKIKLSK